MTNWKIPTLIAAIALAMSAGMAFANEESEAPVPACALVTSEAETTGDTEAVSMTDTDLTGPGQSLPDAQVGGGPTIPCFTGSFCVSPGRRCSFIGVRTFPNGKQCCEYGCSDDPTCTTSSSGPTNTCPIRKGKKN